MPSRNKTTMFASAFLTCVCSFVVICVVLATQNWVRSDVYFSGTNSTVTVRLTYGLFRGTCEQLVDAGLQVSEQGFPVAGSLSSTKTKSTNTAIIVILALSLLSSLLSSGFTCTNVFSNPYQTFLGPIGVYTWNALSGIFVLVAMILFPVNTEANDLSLELAQQCSSYGTYLGAAHSYGYSYWIMLLIIFLNITSGAIIYFYDHARYHKKKQQERPIENAPKDGILF
ncbi:clarin-3 [Apus apus]|uniref:clarin-3 n=1 Tax=Apus apus TaxID=8895 RepID=UPI0021F83D62|nr:clarin-3 [Apus apus]